MLFKHLKQAPRSDRFNLDYPGFYIPHFLWFFDHSATIEELTMGGNQRAFEVPEILFNNRYCYVTSQWTYNWKGKPGGEREIPIFRELINTIFTYLYRIEISTRETKTKTSDYGLGSLYRHVNWIAPSNLSKISITDRV
jgi:hypothetical protein